MSGGRKARGKDSVGDYRHKKQRRKNNPAAGLAKGATRPAKKVYYPEIDPYDAPILLFKDRETTDEIEVDVVPLHVHESVHPSAILGQTTSKRSTLDDFFGNTRPHNEAVEFYQHEDGWTNRIIAGDSLLVMNSLLEKEGMAGRIQMVYFDPPYGIKYNSNFQPRVFDTRARDDVRSVEMRPEQIKAFRDTWEMGIHSYLAMVRKRLVLARDLLDGAGSIFVQISTENQHRIRLLLDEVFGPENFMWQILFRTKGGGGVGDRPNPYDYILWYAKDRKAVKFNRLWQDRTDESIKRRYKQLRLKNGNIISIPKNGKLPENSRRCETIRLYSQGSSTTDRSASHTFPNGKTYTPPEGSQWSLGHGALDELYKKGRLHFSTDSVRFIGYPEDAPKLLHNVWEGMLLGSKRYVVETKSDVVKNCMLMCSDVGDLVLDITGGSGVTAHVAEEWGRRWITCDTSRVSMATIRCRLQTATYPWYRLASDDDGVDGGFLYGEQDRTTPALLSKDEPGRVIRYDKPEVDGGRGRVAGPFTVESIPAPVIQNENDVTPVRGSLLQMLKSSGIRTKTGRMRFGRIDKNPDDTSPIHAYGESGGQRIAISFGPEHGPMGRYQVESVLAEAGGGGRALFLAMAFDPVAKSVISKTGGAQSALINNDVLIPDLKSQRTDQPFSMVGEPDIDPVPAGKEGYSVELRGYDYYDPRQDRVVTGDACNVAMWMLDTDYDGRTLRVKQLFFPGRPDLWEKLNDTFRGEIDPELLAKYSGTKSIPFGVGNHRRVAVKIIDMDGNESLTVRGLEGW